VVEHEEEIMKAADHIIDIGPAAGTHGGELIFSGTYDEIIKDDIALPANT
jgi:excinuclease ABC subunit A